MKIIAVMNQKGGIGKTMTAAAIAYLLGEEHDKRVLICDADQQGNISMLYGRYDEEGQGMAELLENHRTTGGAYATADLIQTTIYSNIDIIPANGYLMRTNMNLMLTEQQNQVTRFTAAMEEVKEAYDYCIVDCGLLMDMTVTNVLTAADMLIEPVKVGGFEVEAALNTNEQIKTLRALNPDIKTKVLLTMQQKNKTTAQVKEWAAAEFNCFSTAVRRSVVAEKSTIAHVPLPAFAKNCIATQDYRAVTEELLKEI